MSPMTQTEIANETDPIRLRAILAAVIYLRDKALERPQTVKLDLTKENKK